MDSQSRTAAPASSRVRGRIADGELHFPERDGRRSTTETCRGIVADAARAALPRLADSVEGCGRWRQGYVPYLRELTRLSGDPGDALAIARAGLDSMRARLLLDTGDVAVPLADCFHEQPGEPVRGTGEIRGTAAPVQRLEIPYRGRLLHGSSLSAQLERWVDAGIVEPSFAEAIAGVAAHPEWLALPGRTVALLGAGSEIGPLAPLCSWGADVLAVDVRSPDISERIRETARRGAGTVRMPVAADGSAGVDLIAELAEARAWLHANLTGGAPVLGMYGYADGGAHVLLSGAFDALAGSLARAHAEPPALACLATPTDAFVVPSMTAGRARSAYRDRRARRLLQAPLKLASGGRLYRPAYASATTEGPAVADALVTQQGPNYAVAKRLQRWRGMTGVADGELVSFNVAPATWTRSVTKNRVLAAAYAGAGHFGIEIFEPATTRALMAALLVGDLSRPNVRAGLSEELFSDQAAHGGLWTAAYEPRSALGLAALAGLPSATLRLRRAATSSEPIAR